MLCTNLNTLSLHDALPIALLTVTGNAFLAQMPKLLHDVQFSTQNHTLLYHAPNFVHADLTMEDVTELLKKQPSVKTEQDAILSENMKTMLNAYAAKDYCTVRKCLITFIHESPRTLKNQKILIDARNKRCWSVMKDHFKENSPKNVAVLYGIMHLPNFHDILIKEGYVLDDTVWRRAMHSNVPDLKKLRFEYQRKNRENDPSGDAFLIRKP